MLGHRLRMLNAPESFAQWLVASALEQVPLDAAVAALGRVTARRLDARLRALAARPRAWAVVEPALREEAVPTGPPPTASPR